MCADDEDVLMGAEERRWEGMCGDDNDGVCKDVEWSRGVLMGLGQCG